MLSRSSVPEPACLYMITIAVIVAGEINHLNYPGLEGLRSALLRGDRRRRRRNQRFLRPPRARPRKQVGVAGRQLMAPESDGYPSRPARPSQAG
jgi:hypothetical protein